MGRKKRVDPRDTVIAQMLSQTRLSVKQIAQALDVHVWRVYSVAANQGIPMRRGVK